jgi:hypothetical protein
VQQTFYLIHRKHIKPLIGIDVKIPTAIQSGFGYSFLFVPKFP